MTRRGLFFAAIGLAATTGPAWANYQSCDGQPVDNNTLRCPDGSIPNFVYGNPQAAPAAKRPASQPALSRDAKFLGVWHTKEEGVGYGHAYDVPGSTQMSGKFSLRAGDLTLDPNGAFVWNTVNGLFGRWISLTDTGEYGKDRPLTFKPDTTDIQQEGEPQRKRPAPYFQDTNWDFMLIITGGKTWHGKVDPDGRLRLRLDDEHVLFGTR